MSFETVAGSEVSPLEAAPRRSARDGLWEHLVARTPSARGRVVLVVLSAAGVAAVARFFDFWFRADNVGSSWLFALLSIALWYGISRIVLGWIALLAQSTPEPLPAPEGLRVAIFTTSSPGEPLAMFERTLAACQRIRYPHTTYLLDDTQDPAFAEVAARYDAVHLPLVGFPGAKAGKINAALERTNEEYVLVLDPDHVPFSSFLDRVLGYFRDPELGFVQVSQAYYNQERSAVATGAAEQTYAFYGPTQMGLHGLGSVLVIGANCTFRRSALESIGGHGIGLAEDLVTAVRLHGAGWKGAYVPEVVARGLVPDTALSFAQQQLKWSRGIYEVLFVELPAVFRRLSNWQRLALSTVATYYLVGPATLIYGLVPHLSIWTGSYPVKMSFVDFVTAGGPVALFGATMHLFAQRYYCEPRREAGANLRGLALKIACWPVYTWGLVLALGDRFVRYVPTAKRSEAKRAASLVWPHAASICLLFASGLLVAHKLRAGTADAADALGMLGFALLFNLMSLPGVIWALGRGAPSRDAWDAIPTRIP